MAPVIALENCDPAPEFWLAASPACSRNRGTVAHSHRQNIVTWPKEMSCFESALRLC